MARDEWEYRPLGELTENLDFKRVPVKGADRKPGPYPYYGASGIVDYVDNFLFDGEHLLIAEDGENLRTRNTPVAFLVQGKFWVNNHAHIVRGNEEANTKFLMYALAKSDISGYLTGSTMPKLTQGNMNRIPILTPPRIEQDKIVSVLNSFAQQGFLFRRKAFFCRGHAMMDLSQRKEQWSQVYLRAIATVAGYTLYRPEVDDDSVDFGLAGRIVAELPSPPRIELQLKGTSEPTLHKDHLVYRLKKKNYDDLRYRDLLVPRLLVVVLIPRAEADWHHHSEDELTIRRCGYWLSLRGLEVSTSRGDKVPVKRPRSHVLSVESLRGLMTRAAHKEPL